MLPTQECIIQAQHVGDASRGNILSRLLCPPAQVKKDFADIVLSARQDPFYARHMYANFGDAGAAVKDLVDEFQKQTTSSRHISTIEDMQVQSLNPKWFPGW